MVQTTADQISALEKENADMKKKLLTIDENRKVADFLSSVVWTFILWELVSIIVNLAEYGSRAMVIEDNMTLLGGALLTSGVIIIGIIVKAYVLYLFVVSTVVMFQKEIETGGVKSGIFLKAAMSAGLKALREAKAKEEAQETVPQESPAGESTESKRDFQKPPTDKHEVQKTLIRGAAGKKGGAGALPAEDEEGKETQKSPPPA